MTGPGSAIGDATVSTTPFWRKRSVHLAFGALVIYIALACLIFWPTGPFDASRLPDGVVGDPDEMTWFLAWTPWALTHGHNIFLTHAIELPQGVNLANNTSVPFLGLLAAPITLTLGPIVTINLLLRLAVAASAAASYFVFRRWCSGETGPFLGGLIFGFSPALLSHLQTYGHLDLVFVPLIPIMVALVDEIVVRQRHSPLWIGALFGVVAAAQYLVSAELFADAVLLGVVGVLWLACSHPRLVKDHIRYALAAVGSGIVSFGVFAGYPIYLALFGPNHLVGPAQAVAHLQRFRTDLAEIIVPDARQLLFPNSLARLSSETLGPVLHAGGGAELGGYLGVPLLATAAALALLARRSGVIATASVLALVSFIASLGSRLQIAGHATEIPLPEVVLSKLPLFDNAVPARFSLFVALFVALVLAVGIDRSLARARSSKTRAITYGLVGLGVAASLVTLLPRVPVSKETPALPATLASAVRHLVPNHAVVLAYPYPDSPYAEAMLWQASDNFGFSLLGGYANVRTASGKGQIFPPLVQPAYVQELLGESETPPGGHSHYPLPQTVKDPAAVLCSFIRTNHVTAVVYQAYGQGAATVRSLFGQALATPTDQAAGLIVWNLAKSDACAISSTRR
jgi:hypothetical protein